MARPLRIQHPNAYYHVMNRGSGRKKLFRTDHHCQLFLVVLADAVRRFQIRVHAYCSMDNHYHLLVSTPNANLDRAMRHTNALFTQRFNRDVNTDGPLFRGRYKAIVVDLDSYLLRLSRYIRRNPLYAGQVKQLERYRWSSYRAYLNKQLRPEWLSTDEVLAVLPKYQREQKYKSYVEMEVDEEIEKFYGKKKWPAVLGSDGFKRFLEKNHSMDSKEKPKHQYILPPINAETIVGCVAKRFNVPVAAVY